MGEHEDLADVKSTRDSERNHMHARDLEPPPLEVSSTAAPASNIRLAPASPERSSDRRCSAALKEPPSMSMPGSISGTLLSHGTGHTSRSTLPREKYCNNLKSESRPEQCRLRT